MCIHGVLWQLLHSHQAICGCFSAAIVYSLMSKLQQAYGPHSWPADTSIC